MLPIPKQQKKEEGTLIREDLTAFENRSGFDSESNQQWLKEQKTYNGICPRSPQELKQRKNSWKFSRLQRRRSQCEGSIGIVKNNFLGRPLPSKGFANLELTVSWAVLTHNL